MKKIKYLVYLALLFLGCVVTVNAASLSVSANKSTVVVGSTVVVTVNANGAAGWEYCINYDSSMLTLSSSTVGGVGSTSCVLTGSELLGGKSVKFTFKAKKSGTATVSLKDVAMYDDNAKPLAKVSSNSVKLTLKTQAEIEASYSTDANLKNLLVDGYELTPAFSKDVLNYELEVENNVENATIRCAVSDSAAKVSGCGKKALTEGVNKYNIVVTAEKGNKKTYVVNITRKELNPIKVMVDGKEYIVVRKADTLEVPTYFTATTVVIDDENVPAFINEVMDKTLVGLKDEEGNIELFEYTSNGEYVKYVQVSLTSLVFSVEEPTVKVKGYDTVKSVDIGGKSIKVYTNPENEFALIYGTNVANGESGWYQYDQKEGTLQRYIPVVTKDTEDNSEFKIISLVLGGTLAFSVLVIIILLGVVGSRGKKNRKLIDLIESKMEMPPEEVQKFKRNVKQPEEDEDVKVVRRDILDDDVGDETKELNDKFLSLIEREGEQKRKEASKKDKAEEKSKKKQEKEEIKAMQEDFLRTQEQPVIEEDVEEVVVKEAPKRRGRPKKVKEDDVKITQITDAASIDDDAFGTGEKVIKRSELTEEDITELKKEAMIETIKEKESKK